ncbi:hypothetical protein M9H77_10664 [Catharanthus roseus]|uniref:Uncharacterized protein n=1 Tax=Catharanthus roseus TaxID=4058 RepID=A0ACC0BCE1_CATRO|nr:hypothetical protein M9H77_10664 [Catharanthus roseus]
MPGQGKTTLAYKVYNDPSVKYHFNKCAWCFVTQVHQRRGLLLNILSEVSEKFDKSRKLSEEDLAEKLYKCLKCQRYLIVMDDIWNMKVWDELKESFSNDNNGSRILFTSRIHTIALLTNVASSTHHLCPLTIEESREVLQKKLFYKDSCCPPYLLDVGKRIAKICEGLPLSIGLTAGVLARRVTDLDWWEEVEGNLSSKIFVKLADLLRFILLTHLRHLVLKNLPLKRLPPSIVNLQNLEVLVVGWVGDVFIPDTIWKMKKLKTSGCS